MLEVAFGQLLVLKNDLSGQWKAQHPNRGAQRESGRKEGITGLRVAIRLEAWDPDHLERRRLAEVAPSDHEVGNLALELGVGQKTAHVLGIEDVVRYDAVAASPGQFLESDTQTEPARRIIQVQLVDAVPVHQRESSVAVVELQRRVDLEFESDPAERVELVGHLSCRDR